MDEFFLIFNDKARIDRARLPCGRGGIGRRSALRSLWEKSRGGSSPLDRTKKFDI